MSDRTVNLFCFPHAGSNASVYVRWKRKAPDWIDVRPVELPGRGRRIDEPLECTVEGMAERCLPQLLSQGQRPWALFGHSLGAIVAFEVARRLRELGHGPSPLLLVASGTDAPCRRDPERHAALDSDKELILELERLGGTPREILDDRELLALALPVVRADFAASAQYRAGPERALDCPIYALGGVGDAVAREGLLAWRQHTRLAFELDMFPGGHFFVHEQEADVLRRIGVRLARALADTSLSDTPLADTPLAAADASFAPAHTTSGLTALTALTARGERGSGASRW